CPARFFESTGAVGKADRKTIGFAPSLAVLTESQNLKTLSGFQPCHPLTGFAKIAARFPGAKPARKRTLGPHPRGVHAAAAD
ncbi:MAG: hypothetical protein IJ074_01475, partial [Clostridia bacterium]|nr:hypothetical protein [Clostridia bacterium]